MNVSIFKTIKDTTGGVSVKIQDVFKSIQNGQWIQHVESVRSTETKEQQRIAKKSVPYFTASGTFNHRKDSGLIEHSGIIAIDFDDLEDVKETKSYLAFDRFSWFTCESISGNGLCVFVKIDTQKHRESFDYLEQYYLKNYGLQIDKACKDISRPRFVTYDPDGILNENAERLSIETESIFDPERIIGIAENMIRQSVDGERHHKLLKASRLMGGYIGSGLLDEITVVDRLCSVYMEHKPDASYKFENTIRDGIEYGKSAPITIEQFKEKHQQSAQEKRVMKQIFSYAMEVNRAGREWDENDVKICCEQFLIAKNKVENIFKTVFDEQKQFFDFDNKPKFVQTEILIADKWEFRRNVVLQSTDCRVRRDKTKSFGRVNYDTIARFVQHCGHNTTPEKIKSLLRSDFVPEYDPIKNYFYNLEKWDGKTDFISNFGNHVQCENQKFWLDMFKKHLVRSVRQIMKQQVNRFVCVLVGEKQSTGKSTFIRSLSPFPAGEYYTESKVRDDKDGQFAFAENFIYNIEELADMGNADVNRLKAMISQAIIKERKPYASEVVPVVRRCTFFGSTNNAQFLTDTENTRWLCHTIKSISWEYTKLNINDVWSQAFALANDPNFNDQLTIEESNTQQSKNKGFEVSDVGKDLISKHFVIKSKHDSESKFFTIADIVEILTFETAGTVKFNSRIVGRNMTQIGFENGRQRVNGNLVRGYYAKRIIGQYKDDDQDEDEQIFVPENNEPTPF